MYILQPNWTITFSSNLTYPFWPCINQIFFPEVMLHNKQHKKSQGFIKMDISFTLTVLHVCRHLHDLIWARLDPGQVNFRSASMCLYFGSQAAEVTVTWDVFFSWQREETPRRLAETYQTSFKARTHRYHEATSTHVPLAQESHKAKPKVTEATGVYSTPNNLGNEINRNCCTMI